METTTFLLSEQVFPKKVLQELLFYIFGGTWKLFLLTSPAVESQFCEGRALYGCNPSPKNSAWHKQTLNYFVRVYVCVYIVVKPT